MATTAVIFDLNGTLTDPASEALRAAMHPTVAEILGIDPAEYAAALAETYPQRVLGAFGDTRTMLAAIAGRLGAAPPAAALDRARSERLRQFRRMLEPRDRAIPVLAALTARGVLLGLVSDCSNETAELWPALEFATYIGQPVFSCRVGMRKPDAAIYLLACTRLGVAPVDCLFVGDGGSRELSGAEAVGMQAVLLRNDHVAPGTEWRVDPDTRFAGRVAGSLDDVLALVPEA